MSTYIPRALIDTILEASRYFPVITLTGPRQSGKSTLYRASEALKEYEAGAASK